MSETTLDVRRLLCPMPVIKTQDKIKSLNPGDLLTVVCTDPGAINDIPTWCRINGHKFLRYEQNDDEIRLYIEVAAS